ncbi:hypothetical protein Bca101_024642 [Brassica carinata]
MRRSSFKHSGIRALGCHVGHFSQQVNPLSIAHVSTKLELKEVIELFLSNHEISKTYQRASKEAHESLSFGIFSQSPYLLREMIC